MDIFESVILFCHPTAMLLIWIWFRVLLWTSLALAVGFLALLLALLRVELWVVAAFIDLGLLFVAVKRCLLLFWSVWILDLFWFLSWWINLNDLILLMTFTPINSWLIAHIASQAQSDASNTLLYLFLPVFVKFVYKYTGW